MQGSHISKQIVNLSNLSISVRISIFVAEWVSSTFVCYEILIVDLVIAIKSRIISIRIFFLLSLIIILLFAFFLLVHLWWLIWILNNLPHLVKTFGCVGVCVFVWNSCVNHWVCPITILLLIFSLLLWFVGRLGLAIHYTVVRHCWSWVHPHHGFSSHSNAESRHRSITIV